MRGYHETERIHVKNYKSCKDVKIELGPMHHAIVGSNNAGKSTVLRAIDFLFNPAKGKIDEEAFSNGNTDDPAWIQKQKCSKKVEASLMMSMNKNRSSNFLR